MHDQGARYRGRGLRRHAGGVAVAGLLGLAVAGAGCDTIGADIDALGQSLFPPSPTQAALWAIDRDPDLRRQGTLLLANATFGGAPPYVALYRDYVIADPDPLVRAVAIRALAKHGEPEDAKLIAVHLDDESGPVRWEAARGLQRLHDPEVTGDLLETLRDPGEGVSIRASAATALGQYPGDAVLQGLVAALSDPSLTVNLAAAGALETLTDRAFGDEERLDPRTWLDWYASAGADAFTGARAYRYPVYRREPGWFERLVFWNPRVVEAPAPPAGLESQVRRRTYDGPDEDPYGLNERRAPNDGPDAAPNDGIDAR